jgi:hypothetical protein
MKTFAKLLHPIVKEMPSDGAQSNANYMFVKYLGRKERIVFSISVAIKRNNLQANLFA